MSQIPRTQLGRVGVVGSTAVKLGVGNLKSRVKRPFLDNSQRALDVENRQDAEAEIMFKAISQLRGTAAKIAQMLGMETDLLPERVSTELAKSYHQMPPLNRVLVRKAIQDELGDSPENIFQEFDVVSIAAASLGQVHRAKLKNDKIAAVKIQYPGIHVTIDSDMKLLSKLAGSATKLLPKHKQPSQEVIQTTIQEIGERLREEVDYSLEADNTDWFKQHLAIDGVQIPDVYADYSSTKVLTTELIDGQHLDQWLDTKPTKEQRNRAAQLIYDLYFKSTNVLGRVHADPNPGNYLYQDNGNIGLIDFGCIKTLSPRFIENLPALLHAFYLNDIEKIFSAYEALGTTVKTEKTDDFENALKPFGDWLAQPLRCESFDFEKNNNYTVEGRDLMKDLAELPGLETINEDFIFFDRTLYGIFKIFEKLEAEVYMRGHWEKLWHEQGLKLFPEQSD